MAKAFINGPSYINFIFPYELCHTGNFCNISKKTEKENYEHDW